jgi:nicotinate-nucleotide adenylyltransferase
MKIGILGGTFDPIHNGHLMLADVARETFNLDEVWFLPNGMPPHKDNGDKTDVGLSHRVSMIKLAIEGSQYFKLSMEEARTDDFSYTYSTLKTFNKRHPTYQLYFIIGADSLFSIERWVNFTEIFHRCTLLAALRGENSINSMVAQIKHLENIYRGKIEVLQTPSMEISSSDIRERTQEGRSISYMVPDKVATYIEDNNLYGATKGLRSQVNEENAKKVSELEDEDSVDKAKKVFEPEVGDIYIAKDGKEPENEWYKKLNYHHKKYDFEKIDAVLKERLARERYLHTQGVMYTAGVLAMKYQVNIYDAMTAGLLHDCGKYPTVAEQLEKIKDYEIELLKEESENPSLLHAPLGAYLAQYEFGVSEDSIINAIRYHTTGRPEMTMLEKILYIADFIEPYRGDNWKFRKIRELSFIDIDQAVHKCAELVIAHLIENKRKVGVMTIQTLYYYGGKEIDTN